MWASKERHAVCQPVAAHLGLGQLFLQLSDLPLQAADGGAVLLALLPESLLLHLQLLDRPCLPAELLLEVLQLLLLLGLHVCQPVVRGGTGQVNTLGLFI